MSTTIVHPGLLTMLTPMLFTDTVTLQVNTPTRGSSGSEVASWANVTGLVNLPCQLAPAGESEVRTTTQTYAQATHTCVIPQYLTTITTRQRATIGSAAYDVLGVDHDSQSVMTRLILRTVTL